MLKNNLMSAPVQKTACRTCPFEGVEAVQLSPQRYHDCIENLQTGGHHFCHSANNNIICRGGRDIQLRIFTAFGHISEPSDEALLAAYQEYMDETTA